MQHPLRNAIFSAVIILNGMPVLAADSTPARRFKLPEWITRISKVWSAPADQPPAIASKKKPLTSRDVVDELVADPQLSRQFRINQMATLRTKIDFQMWNVLRNNPMFAGMEPELDALVNSIIDEAINEARLRMTISRPGDRLYTMAHRVMQAHGFSAKQRANAKIYTANGPINAFTMSPNMDRPVMVVFDGLLNVADTQMATAVIGHEFGHVLNEHVIQDILNIAVFNQIGKIVTGDDPAFSLNEEVIHKIINLETSDLPEHTRSVWEALFLKANLTLDSASMKLPEYRENHNHVEIVKTGRKIFVSALKKITDNIEQGVRSGVPQAHQLLIDYLKVAEATLSEMEVPPDVPQTFRNLQIVLKTGMTQKLDKDELLRSFSLANAAWSREAEASSDFSGLVRSQRGYAMDLVFAGAAPYDHSDSFAVKGAKLRDYLKRAYEEIADFYTKNPEADRNAILGGNPQVSHPFPNLRAVYQSQFVQSVEIVSQANAFLKLASFEQFLNRQITIATNSAIRAQAQLPDLKGKVSAEQLTQIEQQMANLQKFLDKASSDVTTVRNRMMTLIQRFPLDGANPYLNNLLEYKIAERQLTKATFESLKARVAADAELHAKVQAQYENALKQEDVFLKVVQQALVDAKGKAKYPQIIDARIRLANLALNPQATSEQWEAGRTEVAIERTTINNLVRKQNRPAKPRYRIEAHPEYRVMSSKPSGFATYEDLNPEKKGQAQIVDLPTTEGTSPVKGMSASTDDICFDFLSKLP